jgi:hypothetical protein
MMPEILLTEEQTKQLTGTVSRVEGKDAFGRVVGYIDPLPSPEFIAEMKRRAATPGPRYSGTSVLAMLDALQAERDRIGPFSVEYMEEFVERLEKSDPAKYGPKEWP